jgi:ubiquinol-cytochrome c reductase cytochrome c1 subunit
MKKTLFVLLAALGLFFGSQQLVHASTDGIPLDKAPNKTNDLASLQNGAKLFVNYCLNCHSAAYMRYNRLQDIGLTESQIKEQLLFGQAKVGDTMKAAIDPKQAKEWFGANPPDLTVIARAKASSGGTGADYLYTYLRTYYRDTAKETGWNNLAFPNVGMPHVLWQMQGEREPVWGEQESHGHKVKFVKEWRQLSAGTMTPTQYDEAVGDLVNYLQWMSEPAQNSRVRIGVWVLFFLLVFILIAWRLNASFWKDVK